MAEPLTLRVPCKVNLYLEVVGRRPDGYHDIRTVMQAVSLFDRLMLAERADGRIELACSEPGVPAGEENLVVRAARMLQQRSGICPGADIGLRKAIPVGGGLGGGSADAALTLLGLDRLWRLGTSREELVQMAAALGSDVAFFLQGGTALCEGRGERVRPVPCGGEFDYVLVTPRCSVSTRAVYRALAGGLTSRPDASTKVLEAVARGDSRLLGRNLRNDLQGASLSLHGQLGEAWEKLEEFRRAGEADGFLLSGSGAGFLGVVRGRAAAVRAAERWQSLLQVACTAVHSLPSWDFDCGVLTTGRASR
jgi:4-diphosphocytidyl-2-C-methyl-D-erythritol kinase